MISTADLRKVYQLGEIEVNALNGVSIGIDTGEFVSIMGPSGAGKSTLMHLVGLLDEPTSGTVTIDGQEGTRLTDRQKAYFRLQHIGFVFQFYSLLSGFKAYENVELPLLLASEAREAAVERAEAALRQVGLGDRLQHRPSELSGGERQRVAIARAIVNEPAVVLADEPTSELDTATSEDIMDVFRGLAEEGHTVVTVNHEQQIGELADRVIWLEDGEIIER
ncbi:MAG: ABC transporter ATP-binding protein [Candidatus Nanohaloarchaea archaeon]|nr:ABC transporter ATP-binding protein [Candidatus Nanohaloarchaea archaeon]